MPLSYTWHCPSNIALVKYWGKYGEQFPRNASVSFTLGNAYTETTLSCLPLTTRPIPGEVAMTFRFDGQINTAFAAKIQAYLNKMATFLPFLLQHAWHIETCNSFPHSSGIASSASAMGALALCLCSAARAQYGYFADDADFWATASKLARLGSGSACRSIYGQAAVWAPAAWQIAATNTPCLLATTYTPACATIATRYSSSAVPKNRYRAVRDTRLWREIPTHLFATPKPPNT